MKDVSGGERRCAVDEGAVAIRLQDAERLGDERVDVCKVVRRGAHGVDVERVVLEWKMLRISDDPIDVDDLLFRRDPAGFREHLAREVETDDAPDVRGEREGGVPRSRRHVEDEVASLWLGEVDDLLQTDRRRMEGGLGIVGCDIAKAVANVWHAATLRYGRDQLESDRALDRREGPFRSNRRPGTR